MDIGLAWWIILTGTAGKFKSRTDMQLHQQKIFSDNHWENSKHSKGKTEDTW